MARKPFDFDVASPAALANLQSQPLSISPLNNASDFKAGKAEGGSRNSNQVIRQHGGACVLRSQTARLRLTRLAHILSALRSRSRQRMSGYAATRLRISRERLPTAGAPQKYTHGILGYGPGNLRKTRFKAAEAVITPCTLGLRKPPSQQDAASVF